MGMLGPEVIFALGPTQPDKEQAKKRQQLQVRKDEWILAFDEKPNEIAIKDDPNGSAYS